MLYIYVKSKNSVISSWLTHCLQAGRGRAAQEPLDQCHQWAEAAAQSGGPRQGHILRWKTQGCSPVYK